MAVRYLIPYFDLGTGVDVADDGVRGAGGQVWFVRPGGFCLHCAGAIDPKLASQDLMDPLERARIEQRYGTPSPQPAVIHLNAVIASMAVGEVVKFATGLRPPAEMAYFDALAVKVDALRGPARQPHCLVCGTGAFAARGDEPWSVQAFIRAIPSLFTEFPQPVAAE